MKNLMIAIFVVVLAVSINAQPTPLPASEFSEPVKGALAEYRNTRLALATANEAVAQATKEVADKIKGEKIKPEDVPLVNQQILAMGESIANLKKAEEANRGALVRLLNAHHTLVIFLVSKGAPLEFALGSLTALKDEKKAEEEAVAKKAAEAKTDLEYQRSRLRHKMGHRGAGGPGNI